MASSHCTVKFLITRNTFSHLLISPFQMHILSYLNTADPFLKSESIQMYKQFTKLKKWSYYAWYWSLQTEFVPSDIPWVLSSCSNHILTFLLCAIKTRVFLSTHQPDSPLHSVSSHFKEGFQPVYISNLASLKTILKSNA